VIGFKSIITGITAFSSFRFAAWGWFDLFGCFLTHDGPTNAPANVLDARKQALTDRQDPVGHARDDTLHSFSDAVAHRLGSTRNAGRHCFHIAGHYSFANGYE
jgi:hypothetical protein